MEDFRSNSSDMTELEFQDLINKHEALINDRLRVDLKKVLDERDKVYNLISEYLKLENIMELLMEQHSKTDTTKSLKMKVDLGHGTFMDAQICESNYVYVNVGYGFHVQLTTDEARKFIRKKERQLNTYAEELTQNASRIKAHIRMILELLRQIPLARSS